jgi:purine-binding chemotaxis protein CheW
MTAGAGKNSILVAFALNEQRYALRLAIVERIVRMVEITPLPNAPDIVLGVVNLQGRIIPIFNIRRRFGLEEREPDLDDHLLIAQTPRRTVGLFVDEALGIVDPGTGEVISSEKILPGIAHIEGVMKLEEGLLFIHDLELFLSLDEEKSLSEALGKSPGPEG